jgi:hypothetical protein
MSNQNKFFYALVTLFWGIVLFKGYYTSMTHDESTSYIYLYNAQVYDDLFDKTAWSNANNHWLNTLSFQFFDNIFGQKAWAIRLFNMLSFGLYGFFILKLTENIKSTALRFGCILFCIANPYLLDFFSVARGYGISLAFTTAAIYFASAFIKKEENKYLIYMMTFLFLSCVSIFSSVIYIPALIGTIALYLATKDYGAFEIKKVVKPLSIMIGMAIVIAIFIYIPITSLSKSEEFKWGVQNLIETFTSLAMLSSYDKPYRPNEYFLVGVMCCFMIIALYKFYVSFKTKNYIQENSILYISIFLLLSIIGIMIFAKWSTDTFYPSERKTIMFIPLFGLIIFYTLDKTSINGLKLAYVLPLFLGLHFGLAFQKKMIREWWYDQDSKDFAKMMVAYAKGQKSTVGCNWLFHPSLSFYALTKYQDMLNIAAYNKNIDSTANFSYYMCFDSDLPILQNKYNVIYKNLSGRMILKHK